MIIKLMRMKTAKIDESHKLSFKFSQILDLKNYNKYSALQNLFIYYIWKIIRQQRKTVNSD